LRPVLVKDTALVDNKYPHVLVIYGTTKLKAKRRPFDFFIQNASEMSRCGLQKATRFDLDNEDLLPWSDEYFQVPRKLGSLTLEAIRVLHHVLAKRELIRNGG
jgi:hypothetical protein